MLINLFRDLEKNFKVDRLVEFLNRLVLIMKRDQISFIKLLEELLNKVILTALYFLEVKL